MQTSVLPQSALVVHRPIAMHPPKMQSSVAAHRWQISPSRPQALTESPGKQKSAVGQQPLHVAAQDALGTQVPPEQNCPTGQPQSAAQLAQFSPPLHAPSPQRAHDPQSTGHVLHVSVPAQYPSPHEVPLSSPPHASPAPIVAATAVTMMMFRMVPAPYAQYP